MHRLQQEMLFVFPSKLDFFVDEPNSHTAVISIHNPYDYHLRYKIYSTAPDRYKVSDAEGTVKPGCLTDVVIRHIEIALYKRTDKNVDHFRIKVYKGSAGEFMGQRDIPAVIYLSKRDLPTDTRQFQQVLSSQPPAGSTAVRDGSHQQQNINAVDAPKRPSLLYVYLAFFCLAVLFMPLQGETSAFLPDYVRVENSHKLIAGYVLGMLTVVIFKT